MLGAVSAQTPVSADHRDTEALPLVDRAEHRGQYFNWAALFANTVSSTASTSTQPRVAGTRLGNTQRLSVAKALPGGTTPRDQLLRPRAPTALVAASTTCTARVTAAVARVDSAAENAFLHTFPPATTLDRYNDVQKR